MSITTSDMTPADIAAVTGNNCNNDSWGGSWSSWIIIFLIFAMFGWGGFGNGFGGNGAGAADNYVLASDFATLQRQIDSATSSLERKGDAINSGLCDGFYAMNTSLLNGFAGTNNAIQTSGYETRNAIQQSQITEMQNANAIQSQLAKCCCDNKAAIADVNYNMAMNSNATQNAINNGFCQTNYNNINNTRDIIDNQNTNTRAILDALNAQQIAAKDAQIAQQKQEIFGLQLAASQQAQNGYLLSQLKQCPVPAYVVANPYSSPCCNGFNTCCNN